MTEKIGLRSQVMGGDVSHSLCGFPRDFSLVGDKAEILGRE